MILTVARSPAPGDEALLKDVVSAPLATAAAANAKGLPSALAVPGIISRPRAP